MTALGIETFGLVPHLPQTKIWKYAVGISKTWFCLVVISMWVIHRLDLENFITS